MEKLVLQRIRDNGILTMGRLFLVNPELEDSILFQCVTLEPTWILNEKNVSCISPGIYRLTKRVSQKFGYHFHIHEVDGREYILIHTLNYFKQTEGCIGVGKRFKYIDQDSQLDITDSRDTLDTLLKELPDETTIEITEHPKMQFFYTPKNADGFYIDSAAL